MKVLNKTLFYVFVIAISMCFFLPMVWMVLSSFKIEEVIMGDLGSIWAFVPKFSDLSLNAYRELLSMYNIFRNIGNSLIYATISTVVGLIINSFAGYALAKFRFPFKNFILTFIIALMIVPIEATILPLFLVVNQLQLVNTISGYLMPFFVNVMNIFLFRQTFMSYPDELIEAGRIDGLSNFQIFVRIVMPSSKNIFVTIGILTFLASWNDFLWPVMALSKSELMPVQVALNAIFADTYNIFTNHTMAALTIATIPVVIIYVCFQKYIVEDVSRSGIK